MTSRRTTNRKLRGFQNLQARKLMAADIDLTNGVLEIQGTNFNDQIEVRFDDSDNIEVEINSYDNNGRRVDRESRQYDLDDVQEIDLRSLNGIDNIEIFHEDGIDQNSVDLTNHFSRADIHGGSDKDTVYNRTYVPTRLYGYGGDDFLAGGYSADQIFGGSGNDQLHGLNGNDIIMGEAGQDRIHGYQGNDVLYGHNSNLSESNNHNDRDHIFGMQGRDTIRGGGGGDYLYGDDIVARETDRNYIYGDDGRDFIFGGNGTDYMYGLSGHDVMYGRSGSDRMYGGSGSDSMYGEAGHDLMDGGSDGDRMYGGTGNDSMYGKSGFDRLYGEADNDRLDGGLDGTSDELHGGTGSDQFVRHQYRSGRFTRTENEILMDYSYSSGDRIKYVYGYLVGSIGISTF